MKVLVAGATGGTGTHLMNELVARSHKPIALVRESSDTSKLPPEASQRIADLADLPDDVCDDCDVVIFAAGSGSGTSAEMTDKIDRDGAIRLIDLAAKAKVSRMVMLSSVGADDPSQVGGAMEHYLQAKHDADAHLQASGLTYSILRPVALTDDEGGVKIILGDAVDPSATATRADVARVLADAVDSAEWENRTLLMQSELPVSL